MTRARLSAEPAPVAVWTEESGCGGGRPEKGVGTSVPRALSSKMQRDSARAAMHLRSVPAPGARQGCRGRNIGKQGSTTA